MWIQIFSSQENTTSHTWPRFRKLSHTLHNELLFPPYFLFWYSRLTNTYGDSFLFHLMVQTHQLPLLLSHFSSFFLVQLSQPNLALIWKLRCLLTFLLVVVVLFLCVIFLFIIFKERPFSVGSKSISPPTQKTDILCFFYDRRSSKHTAVRSRIRKLRICFGPFRKQLAHHQSWTQFWIKIGDTWYSVHNSLLGILQGFS